MANKAVGVKCIGCPGDTWFSFWRKRGDSWIQTHESASYSYGFDPAHDYQMRFCEPRELSAELVGPYDVERCPLHTGFDDYMIFWCLEGKVVRDYAGWSSRVVLITEEEAAVLGELQEN